jgi:hypothetical protein
VAGLGTKIRESGLLYCGNLKTIPAPRRRLFCMVACKPDDGYDHLRSALYLVAKAPAAKYDRSLLEACRKQ